VHELDAGAERRARDATVNPEDLDGGGDDMTQTPVSPPPTVTPNCSVTSGPAYDPTGSIPVTKSGGRKRAHFKFAAKFGTDAKAKSEPRCCELRQYIKWDKAYHDSRGGPPHGGFPSTATHDTWYEDRNGDDTIRYGHRSGTHSKPTAGCGDEYLLGGKRDMANGDEYCGNDNPDLADSRKGKWNFQLKVIDVCNGSKVKATSSVITVDWN
jgi:hypothetical protein